VPGWITVWLSLGPEGCKVDLGGGSLEVGGAELSSGGLGTSSLGENPGRWWHGPLWKLCHLRRQKTEQASKYSVKSLTSPTCTALHLPRNTPTHCLAGPSMAKINSQHNSHRLPGPRESALDPLMWFQHWGAVSLADAPPPWILQYSTVQYDLHNVTLTSRKK